MVNIVSVLPHSRAERAGILPGDRLYSINFREIRDVLDYRFYLAERTVVLTLQREGKTHTVTVHKDIYDDIGLEFETPLMDKKQCLEKHMLDLNN